VDIAVERADGSGCISVDAFEISPATTYYVDANNTSGMETGTTQYPFSRIQRAVNASTSGCNILVLAGIYSGPGNRDVNIADKVILLRGLKGPTSTIIDCKNSGRAFYLQDINDSNCVIEGFTIRKGFANANGGAIYLGSASPTFKQCIFADNTATGTGGALFSDGGSPRLVNCTFAGNNATDGRALYCVSDSGCGNAIVTNSILRNGGDELHTEGCSTVSITYSDVSTGWAGDGNIDYDPCFIDTIAGDYHLSPYSSCIDAGDPESDYHFEPEPDGGRINMGAYGNTNEATSKGGLALLSYNFKQKLRVGRTSYNYSYTMTLQNNGTVDLSSVQVTMLTASTGISIIDPSVTFGSIDAGEVVESKDTFTININTLVPIDEALISWQANFDSPDFGGLTEMFETNLVVEPQRGDFNGDRFIGYDDLTTLVGNWLVCGQPGWISQDMNKDGIVNLYDFALFANNWLSQ
jgi:hypothetical protein